MFVIRGGRSEKSRHNKSNFDCFGTADTVTRALSLGEVQAPFNGCHEVALRQACEYHFGTIPVQRSVYFQRRTNTSSEAEVHLFSGNISTMAISRSESDPSALLPLPPATFHILLALAEEDRHGYAIIQEVEARTGGELKLSAGTLYRSDPAHARAGTDRRDPRASGAGRRRRAAALLPDHAVRHGGGKGRGAPAHQPRPNGPRRRFRAGAGPDAMHDALQRCCCACIPRRSATNTATRCAPCSPPAPASERRCRRRPRCCGDDRRGDRERARRCTSTSSGRIFTTPAACCGARRASRSPRSCIVALGIGATTAAFSVTDFVLIRPLPFPRARSAGQDLGANARLPADGAVAAELSRLEGGGDVVRIAWAMYTATRRQRDRRRRTAAVSQGAAVNADLLADAWRGAARSAARSRTDDDRAGAPGTVILSYRLWQTAVRRRRGHRRPQRDARRRAVHRDRRDAARVSFSEQRSACSGSPIRFTERDYQRSQRTNNCWMRSGGCGPG